MKKIITMSVLMFCLDGCIHNEFASQNVFAALCGNTYQGKVVSSDPQDEEWRQQVLTLGPVSCGSANSIAMPLAVGSDTSRTWLITGQGEDLELRHQHLHDDGSPDAVSLYGGKIAAPAKLVGAVWQMNFPADQKTIDIFNANDLQVSVTNIWTLEVSESLLVYELNRENRNFRAEFDLR